MSADPKVLDAFKASGASTWGDFHDAWRVRLTTEYSSAIFKGVPAMKYAAYSEYEVQGTNAYFGDWNITRDINTIGRGIMHFSTADFYIPEPKLWYSGAGPWYFSPPPPPSCCDASSSESTAWLSGCSIRLQFNSSRLCVWLRAGMESTGLSGSVDRRSREATRCSARSWQLAGPSQRSKMCGPPSGSVF